jgi:hypothetical protein
MTMTRSWWIVVVGMTVAFPGTVAVALVKHVTELGPVVHQALQDLTYAVFLLGCAIVAVGAVQVRCTGARPTTLTPATGCTRNCFRFPCSI